MKLSKDRILTTHVGSLPRSEKVFKLVFAKEDGKNLDKKEYDEVIADAVKTVVKKQEEVGIDIVSDGEQRRLVMPHILKTVWMDSRVTVLDALQKILKNFQNFPREHQNLAVFQHTRVHVVLGQLQ